MNLDSLLPNLGEWLRGTGPESDVVVSTRIRLARNLADLPFATRATAAHKTEVVSRAKDAIAKADAGADFVQTQFCMDTGVVRRYAARLLELGVAQRVPILIGVAPIPSARSARWMREKLFGTLIPDAIVERLERAADPKREGRAICVEVIRELAAIPGIAGAHVMAPRDHSALPDVLAASGVGGKPRALAA